MVGAAIQFIAYALGMAFVIMVLTVSIALFKGAMVNQIRRVMPYLNSISAGILIIVGGYLIFYWLTEGGGGCRYLQHNGWRSKLGLAGHGQHPAGG